MAKQIIILGHNSGDTVLLHVIPFSNMRLHVKLSDCSIEVHEGMKGDCYNEDRLAVCCSAAAVALPLAEVAEAKVEKMAIENDTQDTSEQMTKCVTHYTYVALRFKVASFRVVSGSQQDAKERRAVTSYAHHITLAYLPSMSERNRNEMRKSMNILLCDWPSIDAECRPMELLSSRGFEVGGRKRDVVGDDSVDESEKWPDTDVFTWYRSNFLCKSLEQVLSLVDNGRFRFINEPTMMTNKKKADGSDEVSLEFLREVCIKYHHRDHGRLQVARNIEAKSRPKRPVTGSVEIFLRATGVSECSEISPLLHYLREMLVFKFGVNHMEPCEDVRVCTKESWHVTPQTNGLFAKRQGKDVADHAEYVACRWPCEL